MTPPRESITWNNATHRFDWSVTLEDGRMISGSAPTHDQARHDMETDWRVRGDHPRYVQRTPRSGIDNSIDPPRSP